MLYSGRDVGKLLEPALYSARKRIIVVSPWISKKYAEELRSKAERGVDVTVVTSTKCLWYEEIARACPSRVRRLLSKLFPFLSKKVKLRLYVLDDTNFVHSKIYVFDNVAFVGSANLTYTSLWKNEETVAIIKGWWKLRKVLKEVKKIIKEAERKAVFKKKCG